MIPMFDNRRRESPPGIGHNIGRAAIRIEVRLFNSLTPSRPGDGRVVLDLPAGGTIGQALVELGLAPERVHLALCNGRDVTRGLNGGVNREHLLENGDVLALSGPVPYSWGYGAPVV